MNLYKVTVKSSSIFTFNEIKGGIYYVVARSKEEAVKYIITVAVHLTKSSRRSE